MLRVGMIGLGAVAVVHRPAIHQHDNATLVAVCDVDQRLKPEYDANEAITFYTDYEEMLIHERLDVVHICLPHDDHFRVTEAAVKRGIHVFLEKPPAQTLAETEALVALEAAYPHVKICVSLQTRLNETVAELKEIVDSEAYGRVVGVKGLVAWYRPESYYTEQSWRSEKKRAGGGVVINQGLHTLDLMQWLTGEVRSLKATTAQLLEYSHEVEDTATARLTFANGATGFFFASLANSRNSTAELQVIFETGKFTIKDSILTKDTYDGKEPVLEDTPLPGTKFYYGASHIKLINRFYAAIIDETDDYIHVRDALPSMQLVDAIYKSAATNETVHFI